MPRIIRRVTGSSQVTVAGNYTVLQVPQGEKWYLYVVEAYAGSGTFKIASVNILRQGVEVAIDAVSSLTVHWTNFNGSYQVLESGDILRVTADTFVLAGYPTLNLIYDSVKV